MEKSDKEKLSKLSPRERINKLKQLEELKRKEVDEIERLIKESVKEIRTDDVAAEIAPKPRDVDISGLFKGEEAQLEKTVKEESRGEDEEPLKYISTQSAYESYKQLQDISYASKVGTINEEQLETLDKIGEKLDRAKYVSASAEAADILVASRATLHKIKKYAGLK